MKPDPRSGRSKPRVVVIGAGMSGILAAIELEQAGYDDVAIYEKADRLGGTWRENTYPGIACDVPSHFYSYSFEPNPDWSHRFSPGAEIQAYFEDVARRYGVDGADPLRRRRSTRCAFEDGRWRLALADGSTRRGRRRDRGDGRAAPSRRCPTSRGSTTSPARASTARAGTTPCRSTASASASSARARPRSRSSSALVGRVGEARALPAHRAVDRAAGEPARTPTRRRPRSGATPRRIAAMRAEISRALHRRASRTRSSTRTRPQLAGDPGARAARTSRTACADPVLREKLRPNYRAACKRLDHLARLLRGHPAAQREARHRGHRAHRAAAAYARATAACTSSTCWCSPPASASTASCGRCEVVGRDGIALDDVWRTGPFAYLAISVPGFPNLFMLNGPNGPVGNFSLIDVAELQIALRPAARRARSRAGAAPRSAPRRPRCSASTPSAARPRSTRSGHRLPELVPRRPTALPTAWPWTFDRFRDEMAAPRLEDYELGRHRIA